MNWPWDNPVERANGAALDDEARASMTNVADREPVPELAPPYPFHQPRPGELRPTAIPVAIPGRADMIEALRKGLTDAAVTGGDASAAAQKLLRKYEQDKARALLASWGWL